MSGYNHAQGMSNRAVTAYAEGKKPLSKFTLEDLRNAGWQRSKKEAIALAKSGQWRPSEWHHSGGTWYNSVDFFDPRDLLEVQPLQGEQQGTTKTYYAKIHAWLEDCDHRVTGSYSIFGGSRRRPTHLGTEKFTGTLRGNWIHLDDGGKKKADGNHISWELLR